MTVASMFVPVFVGRVVGLTLVCHFSVKSAVVVGGVVNVLGSSVGKIDRVGSLHHVTIAVLVTVEARAVVMVRHAILEVVGSRVVIVLLVVVAVFGFDMVVATRVVVIDVVAARVVRMIDWLVVGGGIVVSREGCRERHQGTKKKQ